MEEEKEQVEGVVYEAVYDYEGEAEGDLQFRFGDQIQVHDTLRLVQDILKEYVYLCVTRTMSKMLEIQ